MNGLPIGPLPRPACKLVLAVALGVALLSGCGDGESAQEQYCEAGESLESHVDALFEAFSRLGLADSQRELEEALDAIEDDLEKLSDTATEATVTDVDALEQSFDDVASAVSSVRDESLRGEYTSETDAAMRSAVQNLHASADDVYGTLTDCS